MLLIGLTGGMGCGISTTASYFGELGAVVISADLIARDLTKRNASGWQEIKRTFGQEYFLADDTLNRSRLAQLVFNDETELTKLNAVLHPLIVSEIKEQAQRWRHSDKVVIIEAPLLLEAGLGGFTDYLVVVNTELSERIRRLKIRTSLDQNEILRRIAAQLPLEEKIRQADAVIDNNEDLINLKEEVRKKWQEWQKTMSQ